MKLEKAVVLGQREARGDYRVLSLRAPVVASDVRPGQFVHVRVPNLDGSVLRRPFSVYRAEGDTLLILYKTVGKGTRALSRLCEGDEISVLGPLGKGFPLDRTGILPVLVAGGYGVAPLAFLAEALPARGLIFIGGATTEDILCTQDFERMGWDVRVATEDGSLGEPGRVTIPLDAWLAAGRGDGAVEFFACGPDGMLKAVADRARTLRCKAWLSLDKHMGCGVGACLACVQRVRQEDGRPGWARVCKDGPVFEAESIIWE